MIFLLAVRPQGPPISEVTTRDADAYLFWVWQRQAQGVHQSGMDGRAGRVSSAPSSVLPLSLGRSRGTFGAHRSRPRSPCSVKAARARRRLCRLAASSDAADANVDE